MFLRTDIITISTSTATVIGLKNYVLNNAGYTIITMKSTESAEELLISRSNELESNSEHIKKEVYNILLKIPAGKVSTYGDIAKAMGHPKAARLVGQILHDNPNPVIVPCHRVIHSDGRLGGYAYGSERKRELLENEGIRFGDGHEGYLEEFQKYRIELSL